MILCLRKPSPPAESSRLPGPSSQGGPTHLESSGAQYLPAESETGMQILRPGLSVDRKTVSTVAGGPA